MRLKLIPLLALASAAMPQLAQAASPSSFTPPDMAGFNLHGENDADGDGDKVNETRIKHYLNSNGDSLVSMSINGVVWAWSLDTNGDESGLRNYVIRDSDCDGVFDEVYGLDDEFHIPDCLK
ncbi:MAG TPA: hypothetical protein VET88_09240 [Gammaproteobacteria bacterium]|nr:hypothetical protein [Gammaproteobacteria bacterium]